MIATLFVLMGASVAGAADRPVTGASLWRLDLDPQVAWGNYALNVVYDTYIPLLTYRHDGGRAGSEVIPGLARSLPRVSNRGRTYTLRLRRGLRYSDGERVKASDFKFAVERMFRLAFGSGFYGPGQFYDDIVGARRFEETGRGGIGGITTDDATGKIVIDLLRSERSFSRKLAMTWAAPVPAGTPLRNQTFDPPPATGPYAIVKSTRHGWTYKRNPEWRSHNRGLLPLIPSGHLQTIKIEVVHDPDRAVREVGRGKLDWISEEMSGATVASLRHRFPSRIRFEPTLSTEYFWLDTMRPPFDDVTVRRAVNYAVNRAVFRRISGGQLVPTEQILPPGLPGYRKTSLYPHDLAKARRLIAAADPSAREVTLGTYTYSGDLTAVGYAAYLGSALEALGFTVHLKVLGLERYFAKIENRHNGFDAGIAGYFANYPDPDDFLRGTVDSPPRSYFNENFAQLFVPSLQRTIDRLEGRIGPMPEAGYAAVDRAFTRLAPWVPIGNIAVPLFVSRRIDLGRVVSNPSFGVDLTSLRLRGPRA